MRQSDLLKIMGNNLYNARINAHLTQERVAELVGISTSYYTNIERGNKGMRAITLRRLADVLHISVDSILYENDDVNSHIFNITAALREQPSGFLCLAEDMIHLLIRARERSQAKETREEVFM